AAASQVTEVAPAWPSGASSPRVSREEAVDVQFFGLQTRICRPKSVRSTAPRRHYAARAVTPHQCCVSAPGWLRRHAKHAGARPKLKSAYGHAATSRESISSELKPTAVSGRHTSRTTGRLLAPGINACRRLPWNRASGRQRQQ